MSSYARPAVRCIGLLAPVLAILLQATVAAAVDGPVARRGGRFVVRMPIGPRQDLPGGRRAWTWPGGGLVVTDTARTVTVAGESLLVVGYDPGLCGVSRGRRLLFSPGTYPVDGTLVLSDAGFVALVERGRLTIGTDSLVVEPPDASPPQAAQLLLLAGIALLTFALVLRSRSRLRSSR